MESTLPSVSGYLISPARFLCLTFRRLLTKSLRGSITVASSGALRVPARSGYPRNIFSNELVLM